MKAVISERDATIEEFRAPLADFCVDTSSGCGDGFDYRPTLRKLVEHYQTRNEYISLSCKEEMKDVRDSVDQKAMHLGETICKGELRELCRAEPNIIKKYNIILCD